MSDFTVTERFQFLTDYTNIVIQKELTSLIVIGDPGFGKSYNIMNIINENNTPHLLVKGFATARALYDTLYLNRTKLIVFDDCDSILKDKVAINILKGALDSYDDRTISWLSKNTDKSIPIQFNFQGQIIFISNLKRTEFDLAIKSRALLVDVFLTTEEKITQMYFLMLNTYYKYDFSPKLLLPLQALFEKALLNNKAMNLRTVNKAMTVLNHTKNLKSVEYLLETS